MYENMKNASNTQYNQIIKSTSSLWVYLYFCMKGNGKVPFQDAIVDSITLLTFMTG